MNTPEDKWKTSVVHLTPVDRKWMRAKWQLIRESQIAADKANNEWKAMNESVNEWLDTMAVTDPLQRAQRKSTNLALSESLSTGNWHARNAERHIHDVNLFLRMRELGVL